MQATPSLSELFPPPQDTSSKGSKPNELGQEDFMKLMVAQLENQDPTKPMDNFQFLSQLAQFGTVNGIQDLQTELSSLSSALVSNQALQAASLVGRDVVTDSNIGTLPADGPLAAEVDIPTGASNVALFIQDTSGRLVQSLAIGAAPAGNLSVQWDGTNADGDQLPPGSYQVSAQGLIDGQNQAINVYAHRNISSVTVDPSGNDVTLNLNDGGQIGLSDVKRIF